MIVAERSRDRLIIVLLLLLCFAFTSVSAEPTKLFDLTSSESMACCGSDDTCAESELCMDSACHCSLSVMLPVLIQPVDLRAEYRLVRSPSDGLIGSRAPPPSPPPKLMS